MKGYRNRNSMVVHARDMERKGFTVCGMFLGSDYFERYIPTAGATIDCQRCLRRAERKGPEITGHEGTPHVVAGPHQIMPVGTLNNRAFRCMAKLRAQKHLSSATVSKVRGDLVMILNKASYDLGGLYAMFCRDPEAFNNNPNLQFTHRPGSYQNLYHIALEYCSRFNTSHHRFNIDLMSGRFQRFSEVYNRFWANRASELTKKNKVKTRKEKKKPEYRGVQVTQLGETICRFALVNAHKTDAEFLADVLGKNWSHYVGVSEFKLYYFNINKAFEPTVTEEITWEETE